MAGGARVAGVAVMAGVVEVTEMAGMATIKAEDVMLGI